MKQVLLFSLFLIYLSEGYAQQAAPQLQKAISEGGVLSDGCESVLQTINGNYVMAGYAGANSGDVSGNHGSYDVWVIKTDPKGTPIFRICYGGTNSDYGSYIIATNDGGYVFNSTTSSPNGDVTGFHGFSDYWVVKLNSIGSIQWQHSLGGSNYSNGGSVNATQDGGYIAGGSTSANNGDVSGNHGGADGWVVKLNAAGKIAWQKCVGGTGEDGADYVQQTTDGGYIVAGSTTSSDGDVTGNHGGGDAWILKLDSKGNILWQKCFGGSASEYFSRIKPTFDGGYIAVGSTASNDGDVSGNHGSEDFWVVKLNSKGAITWQKTLGSSSYDLGSDVVETKDGHFMVTGSVSGGDGNVTGFHGGSDDWLVKLDTQGNIESSACYGGSFFDDSYSLAPTLDGGYILGGDSYSTDGQVTDHHGSQDYEDAWLVKVK